MRIISPLTTIIALSLPATAQEVSVECPRPASFTGTVPTSHMILAIDASGSMAGQVGGRSKMEVAKSEALSFLSDIPREVKVGLVVYGHRGNNQ